MIAGAILLAQAVDARLVLLNVVVSLPVAGDDLARTIASGVEVMVAATKAAKKLSQLQRKLHDEGATAHAMHVTGDAFECILEQEMRSGS